MQGVIGVYSKRSVALKALYTLYGVQHRGQESAGITLAGDRSLRTIKGRGLVSNVFDERYRKTADPDKYVAVGCASGENGEGELSPLNLSSGRYRLSLALDGYLPGRGSRTNEEVFGSLLVANLRANGVTTALAETMKETRDTYYSLVMTVHDVEANKSSLIAARDQRGVRPLYVAAGCGELYVTSESAPIDVLENMGFDVEWRRDFRPGAMIVMDEGGLNEQQVLKPRPAHCAFEWVYFGRPDSIIEGRSVHEVRKNLGHALVETHGLRKLYATEKGPRKDMVVIPVPDSGRSVCTGVAEALGQPADEGVIKNAYLGRTYIIDDPAFRKIASDLKHNIIRETVRGKKVIITDDSIVRGTVSESVAKNLRIAGATEVEFLVSYAPIFHPCFSDPADKPLAAAPYEGLSLEEIGDRVAEGLPSIDKVRYNSPENVVASIGLPRSSICTMCISGVNPFEEK
jgi:amidophosphoribosyltransferase